MNTHWLPNNKFFNHPKDKNAKIGDQSIFSDHSILHVFILSDVATKGKKRKKHKNDSYLIFTVYHLLS